MSLLVGSVKLNSYQKKLAEKFQQLLFVEPEYVCAAVTEQFW